MRQIKHDVTMLAGGVALLAGLVLLALLGLTTVIIPAVLVMLAIELRRAIRCVGRAPVRFWRTNRSTNNQSA